MFENIKNIFKRSKKRELLKSSSKDTAKERLHLVLMQDRANVSADFLDLMRQEIIEVIKKYIDIDEEAMDVRLGAETNEDGTQGAPALYANIPIINIKDETRKMSKTNQDKKITNIEIKEEVTTNENNKGESGKEENNEIIEEKENAKKMEKNKDEKVEDQKEIEKTKNRDDKEKINKISEKSTEKENQNKKTSKENTDKKEIKEEKKENEE